MAIHHRQSTAMVMVMLNQAGLPRFITPTLLSTDSSLKVVLSDPKAASILRLCRPEKEGWF